MTVRHHNCYDCLVIGGGPAGLTAALYLARFRREVVVIDEGRSRALGIPRSHNYPGFVEGISGEALLQTLRTQAERYSANILMGTVTKISSDAGIFVAESTVGKLRARKVLMATGITDVSPELEVADRTDVRNVVRYCPICDGFEGLDKNIAVYGPADEALKKARFLRIYSRSVTIMPSEPTPRSHACAFERTIEPPKKLIASRGGIRAQLSDGQEYAFDILYPVLGCNVHSALATAIGATTNAKGCLIVNDKQETTVRGLYAAGDVVSDLHQIVVAEAHGAIAATTIHNDLPFSFR